MSYGPLNCLALLPTQSLESSAFPVHRVGNLCKTYNRHGEHKANIKEQMLAFSADFPL